MKKNNNSAISMRKNCVFIAHEEWFYCETYPFTIKQSIVSI